VQPNGIKVSYAVGVPELGVVSLNQDRRPNLQGSGLPGRAAAAHLFLTSRSCTTAQSSLVSLVQPRPRPCRSVKTLFLALDSYARVVQRAGANEVDRFARVVATGRRGVRGSGIQRSEWASSSSAARALEAARHVPLVPTEGSS
jgi:hypothetical protein